MCKQNVFVMRKFKEVQKEHLQADEPCPNLYPPLAAC